MNSSVTDKAPAESTISIGPRIELPRDGQGVVWGAKRRCLAQRADGRAVLFIVPGHSSQIGSRGSDPYYFRTALVLAYRDEHSEWRRKTLAEGRITNAVLQQHAEEIDARFGCPGLAKQLRTSHTVTIAVV